MSKGEKYSWIDSLITKVNSQKTEPVEPDTAVQTDTIEDTLVIPQSNKSGGRLSDYKKAFTGSSNAALETLGKGFNQLGENPLAGMLNLGLGAGEALFSPISTAFSLGSELTQDIFGKQARSNLDTVLDLPARGVREGQKLLDKVLPGDKDVATMLNIKSGGATNVSGKDIGKIAEPIGGINELMATVLGFKGLEAGAKGLKPKLPEPVKTDIKSTDASEGVQVKQRMKYEKPQKPRVRYQKPEPEIKSNNYQAYKALREKGETETNIIKALNLERKDVGELKKLYHDEANIIQRVRGAKELLKREKGDKEELNKIVETGEKQLAEFNLYTGIDPTPLLKAGVRKIGKVLDKKENVTDPFQERMKQWIPKEEVKNEGLELAPQTIGNVLEQTFLDQNQRANQLVKQGKVKPASDVAAKLELFSSKAATKYDDILKYAVDSKNSLFKRMDKDKVSLVDLGEYMYAKEAKVRNPRLEVREGTENASGLSDVNADKILNKYKDTPVEKYAKEFKENVTDKILEVLNEADLLTPEEYTRLKNNEYWSPLKGKGNQVQTLLGTRNLSVGSKGIFRARGRQSAANNPVAQTLLDYRDAVLRAEKNKVNQSLAEFIKDNPNENLYSVKGRQGIPSFNEKGDFIKFDKFDLKDNQIAYFEGGKQKVITIEDPPLLKIFKNLGSSKSLEVLNTANNYLRTVLTIADPRFLLRNFEKDIQTAGINLAGEQSVKLSAQVVKDVPSAMKGIWKSMREKAPNEWSKEFQEFREMGAQTGWMDFKDIAQLTKDFEKKITRQKGNKRILHETIRFVEDMNIMVENAVRLSTYKNSKKTGLSPTDAARLAKNLTVNFNKKGTAAPILNSLYLFWNAGAQGSARMYRALKHKNTRKLVTGLAGAGFLSSYMNRMIDPESYDKIPGWEKDNNWIFMMGNGKHLKVRLPYGYNTFYVLGTSMADMTFGEEGTTDMLSRVGSAAVDAFNPWGAAGSWLQLLSPTVIDPFVQIVENKNFAGTPIYKEQSPYMTKPEHQMHFKSVNNVLKEGTSFINKLSGGNEIESGSVDVNPEVLEHYLEFLGGGVAKTVMGSVKTGWSIASGEGLPALYKIPIVGDVVGEPPEWHDTSLIYEMSKESSRTLYSVKESEKFRSSLQQAYKDKQITAKQLKSMYTRFRKNQIRLKRKK